MAGTLAGKRVLVTGGTTGIGRAIALSLLSEGARILVYGRDEQHLQDALRAFEEIAPGQAFGLTADQAKEDDLQRVFQQVDSQLGGLDVLVANAAVAASSVAETEVPEIHETLHINLLGTMVASKLAAERLQDGGQIVVIGSVSAKEKSAGSDIYVATKSALRGFSESFGKGLKEKGIRVTLLEPGLVGSDMTTDKVPVEEQPQEIQERKMLDSADIAASVQFIVSQPTRVWIPFVQVTPQNSEE